MRNYLAAVALLALIPIIAFSDVFNGLTGDIIGANGRPVIIGKSPSNKVGFYGATATPKPIITGSVTAANLEAALAAMGIVATATPTATSTPTPTATNTPTPTPTTSP